MSPTVNKQGGAGKGPQSTSLLLLIDRCWREVHFELSVDDAHCVRRQQLDDEHFDVLPFGGEGDRVSFREGREHPSDRRF